MRPPILLRGIAAIAAHLTIDNREAERLRRQGMLPVFKLPGDSAPHATAGGLDEWRAVGSISAHAIFSAQAATRRPKAPS